MARKKTLASQIMQAYRDAQKAKAAELKRQQQEHERQAKAAERETARLERQRAQEQAAAQRAAQRELEEQARRAQQIERDLAKRQAERARAAERQAKERARKAAEAERLVRQEAVDALKQEAVQRSEAVQARVRELEGVLRLRTAGLDRRRSAVERGLVDGGSEGLCAAVENALRTSVYPAGLGGAVRAVFAPETRELVLELDLPGQNVVPAAAGYRYKAGPPPQVAPLPRKEVEVKEAYRVLVARLVLRCVDEVFTATPPPLVDTVAVNAHVSTKDRATGKSIRPCLVSVRAGREGFEELVLDEPSLDPVECLRHLNAIVSQHPYDLEPVRPVVTFDLERYKLAPEIDVVAGLDSRPDLVALDPIEFEHLIRRLFEAIGLKAWVTQASRDDGVDAVAYNEEPIVGGLCIIQAKRTKNTVPAEAVRALAGVMHDKAAAKGILVTTAWYGRTSREFAQRTGRMELIDGRGLKALLREHLGIDALLGLPKLPPGWAPRDLT
ncbi:restriction endonuclease [Streptacidiphilus griseoplanus]|uniref:restriction endonuclease n=1 Tax=Peterkaempfera griseoplana TaxID=66896 RepID=UPI000AAC4153|nr:restriction endonuclease [Peterkaempfera griseoplana]